MFNFFLSFLLVLPLLFCCQWIGSAGPLALPWLTRAVACGETERYKKKTKKKNAVDTKTKHLPDVVLLDKLVKLEQRLFQICFLALKLFLAMLQSLGGQYIRKKKERKKERTRRRRLFQRCAQAKNRMKTIFSSSSSYCSKSFPPTSSLRYFLFLSVSSLILFLWFILLLLLLILSILLFNSFLSLLLLPLLSFFFLSPPPSFHLIIFYLHLEPMVLALQYQRAVELGHLALPLQQPRGLRHVVGVAVILVLSATKKKKRGRR